MIETGRHLSRSTDALSTDSRAWGKSYFHETWEISLISPGGILRAPQRKKHKSTSKAWPEQLHSKPESIQSHLWTNIQEKLLLSLQQQFSQEGVWLTWSEMHLWNHIFEKPAKVALVVSNTVPPAFTLTRASQLCSPPCNNRPSNPKYLNYTSESKSFDDTKDNESTLPGPTRLPSASSEEAGCICDGGNPAQPWFKMIRKRRQILANLKDSRIGINEEGSVNHSRRR